jgi:hypothetical protein
MSVGGASRITFIDDKVKENDEEVEVIGIKTARLLHLTDEKSGTLTQTTAFYAADDWYTLTADSARIKLTNATGAERKVWGASLRGQAVYRYSGSQGYIHDSFADYDDILRNGEREFKIQNNMICDLTQINQLADYWWKVYKTKKHIYQIELRGALHYYKIGNWYTLQIGGAGQAEYIDSLCVLIGKTVEHVPGSLGSTVLTLREVEENWKFDSNETARLIAAGYPSRMPGRSNKVTVASGDYLGAADYYCDGTDDQEEIQKAIDFLATAYGGGECTLTNGTFNTTAAIELESNITFSGAGAGTIINKNGNFRAIECVGTLGSEKTGVVITGMTIRQDATDANTNFLVFFEFVTNCLIQQCWFLYSLGYSILISIATGTVCNGNYFTGTSVGCIRYDASTGLAINNNMTDIESVGSIMCLHFSTNSSVSSISNTINNVYSPASVYGIYLFSNDSAAIESNYITNLIGTICRGIHAEGSDFCSIGKNIVRNVAGISFSDGCQGIRIESGTKNKISGNYCIDNGALIDYGNCEAAATPPQTDGNLATNTTAARSDVEAYKGTYSYKITKSNAAGTGASYWFVDNNTTTDLHGLGPKQGEYTLKFWCFVPSTGGPTAAEVRAVISEYDSAWNDTTDAMVDLDTWTELECSVTIDSGSTGFRCGIKFLSTAAINEFVYIDNVRLIPMGVANAHGGNFYDGGTDTMLS